MRAAAALQAGSWKRRFFGGGGGVRGGVGSGGGSPSGSGADSGSGGGSRSGGGKPWGIGDGEVWNNERDEMGEISEGSTGARSFPRRFVVDEEMI